MSSNSATGIASQQSIKAYVDTTVAATNEVVEDSTPQLGGNLDTNGNMIQFGDSSSSTDDRLKFGASDDLQIFHAGTENFIRGNSSSSPLYIDVCENLNIRHLDTDGSNAETMIKAVGDGAVELYHDNSKKLETTSTGIDVTGTVVSDGLTVAGNVSVDGGTIKLDGNFPTGSGNVALGDNALGGGSFSGGGNTAIGDEAGDAISSGDHNTAIGEISLTDNTTGSRNTAIGRASLFDNTKLHSHLI